MPGRLWLLAWGLFPPARALRSAVLDPLDGAFLYEACTPPLDGLGGRIAAMRNWVTFALDENLTLVCNPRNFDTELHQTGNLGYLFGCMNTSSVVGALIANDTVRDLEWRGFPKNWSTAPMSRVVYWTANSCKWNSQWGRSFEWFRSQYHLVRRMDSRRHQPRCWKGQSKRKNIVLAIRRGDFAAAGKPVKTYLRLLDLIFQGRISVANISEDNAHIVVIAETPADSEEIQLLRSYLEGRRSSASFLVGAPEVQLGLAQERLVRDLDCMALADVLVLSDSGFSDLGAALQLPPGISLMLGLSNRRNEGLPNRRKIRMGRFTSGAVSLEPGDLPNVLRVRISV